MIRYILNINILNRLMFFFDNEFNCWIEKVFLDGWNRVLIVYNGLLRVFFLIVDIINNRLFWVDYVR